MWSLKNRIPLKVRLAGLALLVIASVFNATWSAIDGDFGHDFWIPLILMGCFIYWFADAIVTRKRDNRMADEEVSAHV